MKSEMENVQPNEPIKSKPQMTYEQRIAKMSDKQLTGELRRQSRASRSPRHVAIAEALLIIFDNHKRGVRPILG